MLGTACDAALACSHQPRLRRRPHCGTRAAAGSETVKASPALSRRELGALVLAVATAASPAHAAVDALPRPSLAEATRPTSPAPPLPAAEQAIVDAFARLTYGVVNVVDVTVAQAGLARAAAGVAGPDVPEGNGSGVVWDDDGHIVTNYHVLAGVLAQTATSKAGASGRKVGNVARVTLLGSDGKSHEYVAELVGADRAKDLAVLRVNAPKELLRPVPRGRSKDVRVGQTVLAIGNPFGFDHTLTTGVVSGLDRTVASSADSLISGGIQTDAAINPGNSGGPLLSSSGELVGINTAIFTPTGLSAGVGFAIPVDTVARVVPQLIQFGAVVRPSLNVTLAPDGIASQLRVKGGALVQAVAPGSAAAAAGLLPTRRGLGGIVTGDVIVGVGDDPVRSPAELLDLLERRAVGDTVVLHVVRGVGGDGVEQQADVSVRLEAEGS